MTKPCEMLKKEKNDKVVVKVVKMEEQSPAKHKNAASCARSRFSFPTAEHERRDQQKRLEPESSLIRQISRQALLIVEPTLYL